MSSRLKYNIEVEDHDAFIDWFDTYISPLTNRVYWSTETCNYPRLRKVVPANFDICIKRGYLAKYTRINNKECFVPLKRLDDNKWAELRKALALPFGHDDKQWLFLRYNDDDKIAHIPIDIDFHGENDNQQAWDKIRAIEELGLKGFWTTTAGRYEDVKWIPGLNFNIVLDESISIREIRPLEKRIHKLIGEPEDKTWEKFCCQEGKPTRNYRFPMQYNIVHANVDSENETITYDCNDFDLFLSKFKNREKNSLSELYALLDSKETKKEEDKPIEVQPVKETKDNKKHSNKKIRRNYSYTPQYEECAFKRMVHSASKAVIAYRGDKTHLVSIVEETKKNFIKACSPYQTDHITKPELLKSFAERVVRGQLKTFNPEKCRFNQNDNSYTKTSYNDFLWLCRKKRVRLSNKEKGILYNFNYKRNKWNGSVDSRYIYKTGKSVNSFCSMRDFLRLRDKLIFNGILQITRLGKKKQHLCNKYELTEEAITLIKKKKNEKKEVTIVQHKDSATEFSPESSPLFDAKQAKEDGTTIRNHFIDELEQILSNF